MNRRFAIPSLLIGCALFTAIARAENASTTILPGDRLHGNIVASGDEDRIEVYLPAGALLSVDLRAEKGSDLLPGLALVDPEEQDVDLAAFSRPGPGGVGMKAVNVPVGEAGGVFFLRVLATEGTDGKYLLRTKVKLAKKTVRTINVPAAASGSATVEAMAGSVAAYKVGVAKGVVDVLPAVSGFDGPEIPVPGAGGLKAKKLPLAEDGVYTLTVQNQGGADGDISVQFTVKGPKPSKRELYLSPTGFGEAPRIASINPDRVLDDRTADDLEILGEHFDDGAAVRLERKGEAPLLPTAFTLDGDGRAVASFDVVGVRAGGWSLVMENPSGGLGSRKFTVQKAGAVKLPAGVVEATEVWWLDFDADTFPSDLAVMGLGSSSTSVSEDAAEAVKQYVLYYARRAFALTGIEGRVEDDAVPVSFVLEAPPSTVGAAGSTWNRLSIGGVAGGGDPSSNPNYNWGDSPLDTGNAAFQNLGRDAGTGLGIRVRSLVPATNYGTAGWIAAMAPMQATPLSAADAIYFQSDFVPADEAQGLRYKQIATALRALGRELGGTVAHFVARSMGVADGITGLSHVPVQPGEYFAELTFGFTAQERLAMAGTARDEGLPGTSKTLKASLLPTRETRPYLLPDATTTVAYSQAFAVVGGRPDITEDERVFLGVAGAIPSGFTLSPTGIVSGTTPLFIPGQGRALNGGVYRFLVRVRDTKTGEDIFFTHRINLLVDANNGALSPAEMQAAVTLNGRTLSEP